VTVVIPAFTIFLLSSMIVLFEILIATVFVYTRGIVIYVVSGLVLGFEMV
jgi:hypothetical protein